MALFPGFGETALHREDNEVNVTQFISLAAGKRPQQYESKERRSTDRLSESEESRPLAQVLR
jgi:hypothetical protein